jgi:hypothetical protein
MNDVQKEALAVLAEVLDDADYHQAGRGGFLRKNHGHGRREEDGGPPRGQNRVRLWFRLQSGRVPGRSSKYASRSSWCLRELVLPSAP